MNIIHRIFRRLFGTPKPVPTTDYVRESDLPGDPDELVRLGVIRPWRTECSGERWYVKCFGGAK